jgi:hypothetical protein
MSNRYGRAMREGSVVKRKPITVAVWTVAPMTQIMLSEFDDIGPFSYFNRGPKAQTVTMTKTARTVRLVIK